MCSCAGDTLRHYCVELQDGKVIAGSTSRMTCRSSQRGLDGQRRTAVDVMKLSRGGKDVRVASDHIHNTFDRRHDVWYMHNRSFAEGSVMSLIKPVIVVDHGTDVKRTYVPYRVQVTVRFQGAEWFHENLTGKRGLAERKKKTRRIHHSLGCRRAAKVPCFQTQNLRN